MPFHPEFQTHVSTTIFAIAFLVAHLIFSHRLDFFLKNTNIFYEIYPLTPEAWQIKSEPCMVDTCWFTLGWISHSFNLSDICVIRSINIQTNRMKTEKLNQLPVSQILGAINTQSQIIMHIKNMVLWETSLEICGYAGIEDKSSSWRDSISLLKWNTM